MSYKEALAYILQIPMFQNCGKSGYNPSLEKITRLCKALGNPQNSFKSIHIAGTNGKGSTSHLLQSALIEAGYKTALYTSPHLTSFRERATINNSMIDEEYIAQFIGDNLQLLESEKPSFFELTTLLAFCWFAQQRVDVAVIEAGLGGRLDATNVITPELCIVTNVSKDHVDILGSTLQQIATEKSGIIKKGIPIIIGDENNQTFSIFSKRAEEVSAPLILAPKEYKFSKEQSSGSLRKIVYLHLGEEIDVTTNLMGLYQIENIATALTAIKFLREKSIFNISHTQTVKGFSSTTLKGRWQTLSTSPLTICDTGHNQAGVEFIVKQLEKQHYNKLYVVLGVVADKDVDTMLSLLPKEGYYIFTKSKVARALNEKELERIAAKHNLKGECASSVAEAVEAAKQKANGDDLLFIGGSSFTVAELF